MKIYNGTGKTDGIHGGGVGESREAEVGKERKGKGWMCILAEIVRCLEADSGLSYMN